jgi:hypothetical protein
MASVERYLAGCSLDGVSEVYVIYNSANLKVSSIDFQGVIGRRIRYHVVDKRTDPATIYEGEFAKNNPANISLGPYGVEMQEVYEDGAWQVKLPDYIEWGIIWLDPERHPDP